jgi:hypothetical protein
MYASTEGRVENFEGTRRRRPSRAGAHLRLVGLALAAAGLVALAPAAASATTMVVHSAERGQLAGGRLTLYGVGGHATATVNGDRSGAVRIARVHRRLFLPGRPATGTLHIGGHRGGEEPTFRLSRPHFNAARGTVSYRVRRLGKRSLRARAAAAGAAQRFGAASLSVVPHPAVAPGVNGGNDCFTGFQNNTNFGVQAVSSEKWDTDTWGSNITPGEIVNAGRRTNNDFGTWESDGGLWRGCANHATWTLVVDPTSASRSAPPSGVTIDVRSEWDWGSSAPAFSCNVSNPRFTCIREDSSSPIFSLADTDDCRCMDAVASSRAGTTARRARVGGAL